MSLVWLFCQKTEKNAVLVTNLLILLYDYRGFKIMAHVPPAVYRYVLGGGPAQKI